MVARVKLQHQREDAPPNGQLMVMFLHNGVQLEAHPVATPERALKTGLLMLARRDEFNPGDSLVCRRSAIDNEHSVTKP